MIVSPGPLHLPVLIATGASAPARDRSRPRRRAALVVGLGLMMLPGCSGSSSFLAGSPTRGQLKTSVAHLEYENAQMKRDLAKLRRDNRTIEDKLVQEEQDNGELAARLDDARNLLRERGLDPVERADAGVGARTLPAGQSSRKRRKPPVARIPGQFTPDVPASDRDDDGLLGPPQAVPGAAAGGDDAVGLRGDDGLDHHTDYNGPLRWAPIARQPGDGASQVR
jgi:hypothetical protein